MGRLFLLAVGGLMGCGMNHHIQSWPGGFKLGWEMYRVADPQILVDVYRATENITAEEWSLLHDSAIFTVIPGHPKGFDGSVFSVIVHLDNVPLEAHRVGNGYRVGITTGCCGGTNWFRNIAPGRHTLVAQVNWQTWKPYWYKGRPTRDLVTWTWATLVLEQATLTNLGQDYGLYRPAKSATPRIVVRDQGRWVDVTGKQRLMLENAEEYRVMVGQDGYNGFVEDVVVFLDNEQVAASKAGHHYIFGISTGFSGGWNWFRQIQPGLHKIRVEVRKVGRPLPTKDPPGEIVSGSVTMTAYSVLMIDPMILGW